jgi:hypothetical protein
MKSTKVFNNISDKLRASIPKLRPREVKTFVMLNGTPNPDPDEKERSKHPVLYGRVQVRTNFRIYDPHVKDADGNEVGGYIDVGCVDQWDGDKPSHFRFFVPGLGEYSMFGGKFSLTGGNVRDEELWEVLWLSPEREGSPCKDEAVAPRFRLMDAVGDSKTALGKVDRLRKALDLAANISEEDSRRVLLALGQSVPQDKGLLKAKIGEFARDKYEDFLKTYDDPNSATKAAIQEAVDLGVLSHDIVTGDVKIGDVAVTNIKVQTQDDLVNAFTNFVVTAEGGKDVLNNVNKQLKSKKQPVK